MQDVDKAAIIRWIRNGVTVPRIKELVDELLYKILVQHLMSVIVLNHPLPDNPEPLVAANNPFPSGENALYGHRWHVHQRNMVQWLKERFRQPDYLEAIYLYLYTTEAEDSEDISEEIDVLNILQEPLKTAFPIIIHGPIAIDTVIDWLEQHFGQYDVNEI